MYNWIANTFNVGEGVAQGLALVISLVVVLVLFALFISIIKRLMGARMPQGRGRQPRIAIMDSATVDTRRRLLLIRRDNVEHLILIGGPTDVVVEPNIIRHTPLASAHPGNTARAPAYPAPANGGAVRAPTAPGPDIPATPEDLMDDRSPMLVPSPAPAPVAPKPAPTAAPAPSATPSPAAATSQSRSATPEAQALRPVASTAMPSRTEPRPTFGSGAARPTTNSATPAASPASGFARPSSSLSHVAPSKPLTPMPPKTPEKDLLRAAVQNGIEKAAINTPSGTPAAPVVTPVAPTPPAAPSVESQIAAELKAERPEQLVDEQDDEPKTGGLAGSALRTLARPFSPKDRPSYAGGKISPPASGPAARAKTALTKPLDFDPQDERIEPSTGDDGKSEAELPDASDLLAPQEPVAKEASSPSSMTTKEPEDLGEPGLDIFEDDLAAADEAPQAKQPDAVQEVAPLDEVSAESKPEDTETAQSESLEEKPKAAVAANADEEQTEPKLENAPANKDTAEDKAATVTPKPAAPSSGLGERNPIEDEMAKLLSELGGQQKQ